MWLLLLALHAMGQRPSWKVRINLDPPTVKAIDKTGYSTQLLIDQTNASLSLLIENPATRESYKLPARSEFFAIHEGKKLVAMAGKTIGESFATADGPTYLQGCYVYNFSGKLLFSIDAIQTRDLFFTTDGVLIVSSYEKVMAYNSAGIKLWEKNVPTPDMQLLNDLNTVAIETFEFKGLQHALHVITAGTGREIFQQTFSNNQSLSALHFDASNNQLLLARSNDYRSGELYLQQIDLVSRKILQSPAISQTVLAMLAVKNKTTNTWYFLLNRLAPDREQIHFAKWDTRLNSIAISEEPVGNFHPADFSLIQNKPFVSGENRYTVRYQNRILTIRF
jgi:hypothetical protein